MKKHKRLKGMTIVEIMLALALMMAVMAGAFSAIYYVLQNNVATVKLEEDRYNVRMALLSISRETHRTLENLPEENVDVGDGYLTLHIQGGVTVKYTLNGGVLERNVTGGNSPIVFIPVNLTGFTSSINGKWLTLILKGEHNLEITTTVSLSRTPTERF